MKQFRCCCLFLVCADFCAIMTQRMENGELRKREETNKTKTQEKRNNKLTKSITPTYTHTHTYKSANEN